MSASGWRACPQRLNKNYSRDLFAYFARSEGGKRCGFISADSSPLMTVRGAGRTFEQRKAAADYADVLPAILSRFAAADHFPVVSFPPCDVEEGEKREEEEEEEDGNRDSQLHLDASGGGQCRVRGRQSEKNVFPAPPASNGLLSINVDRFYNRPDLRGPRILYNPPGTGKRCNSGCLATG